MSLAVYPGTFDPITNGHVDILRRSLKILTGSWSRWPRTSARRRCFRARSATRMITEALGRGRPAGGRRLPGPAGRLCRRGPSLGRRRCSWRWVAEDRCRDPPTGILGKPQVAPACRPQSTRTGIRGTRHRSARGIVLERYRRDFPQILRRCRVRSVKPGTIRCLIFSRPEQPLSSCRSHPGARPSRAYARNGSRPAAFSNLCLRTSCRPTTGFCHRSCDFCSPGNDCD